MESKYLKYVEAFKRLDVEQKKKEIFVQMLELLKLLYMTNHKINEENKMLPVLDDYHDEEEYLDELFSLLISIKEENAKLIEFFMK